MKERGNGTKKEALVEATMRLVAEGRMENFSCSKAAIRAGCTERLLFTYFGTKKNLLDYCYKLINKDISDLFEQMEFPDFDDSVSFEYVIRKMWCTYIRFLVGNDYKTIFYFEYCNSEYTQTGEKLSLELGESGARYFTKFYAELDKQTKHPAKISFDTFSTYFLDTASNFAIRIIRGVLPKDEKVYDEIWRLFFKGLQAMTEE
jgi:AcrR family transcriptional regulator